MVMLPTEKEAVRLKLIENMKLKHLTAALNAYHKNQL